MDALQPALDGQIMIGQDQLEFKIDGASWIDGGQLWVLELEPAESFLPGTNELEEPQSATTVELTYSSAHSKQTPETGLAIQEYQHESDKINSRAPGHLQAEATLIGDGEAFRQSLKRSTHQNSRPKKLLRCDQCEKAFRYPSDLARHRGRRHKAAKQNQSQPETDSPTLLESMLLALQRENTFTKSSKAFHQNSEATTGQNARPRKLLFCNKCGKAFSYPSHVARHQSVHARQKAAKVVQSASETANSSPRELTPLATPVENNSVNHSKAPSQNANVTTKQNRDPRRGCFCNQCGKAFRYPSDVTRHQRVHSRHKAAKQSRSQSEVDHSSLSETPLLALQRENVFTKSGKAFHRNSKAVTGQNAPPRKLLFCDQCGKAFRYPSHVARHQSVHARQKTAKGAQAASEIDISSPRELTPLATPVENNSSETLSQNSVVTSKRSLRHRKRRFCNQCGEACSPELSQHHSAHSRQKAAKRVPSEAEDCSPYDLTSLMKLLENISLSSSRALRQNSKGTTHQSSRCRRRCFSDPCGDPYRHLSDLVRHLRANSEQKAAKPGQSQSEASSPSSAVLAENAFANSSRTLAKKAKTATKQSIHRKREIFCGQCGKAFRYPSDLARHQAVHSRQKGNLSPWEADSPTSLGPTPVEPRAGSTLTNSSRALHRNSKVTPDQHFRGSKLHFCAPCEKVFRYRSDLTQHKRVHSKRKAAVPLPKVSQKKNVAAATVSKANSPSSMRATARNGPATKPYLCDQCGEGFWWSSELTQHEYTHYHERPYYCSICGRQFRRRVQLVKHQRWHEDSQEGEGKGATFRNVDLDNGVGRYLPIEALQALPPETTGEPCGMFVSLEGCEAGACDAGGKDISKLHSANSMWEIGISGQPYLLPLPRAGERGCYETDEEGGSSTRPTEPSLQVEDASCTILEPTASSSESFTATASPRAYGHLASEPKGRTSTPHVSIDCVAWLPQKSGPDPEWSPSPNRPRQLRERSRSSVQGAKPHSCPICSKRFKHASYLTRHLNVHQPGKPHSCTFCERTFGRRSYLLKHLKKMHRADVPHLPGMHSARVPKAKPSTASVTTGRPPRISSADPEWLPSQQCPRQPRKRDRSCAQGAEPHSCPICSKRFKCADYLTKHLNIHRPGKLDNCTLCEKKFSQRLYLLKHLRKVHGVRCR